MPALRDLLAREAATVVDLSTSRDYLHAHIPGAWFAIRTRLDRAFKMIPHSGTFVLTSEDGVLASLAVTEAKALTDRPIRTLAGGNAAWRAAGQPFSAEARMADEAVDQWRKPYERSGNTKAMMQEYLDWEVDLLPRIARDGSLHISIAIHGRGFQQQLGEALRRIDHHVVAARYFMKAPGRIGFHRCDRAVEAGIGVISGANIGLARNLLARAGERIL